MKSNRHDLLCEMLTEKFIAEVNREQDIISDISEAGQYIQSRIGALATKLDSYEMDNVAEAVRRSSEALLKALEFAGAQIGAAASGREEEEEEY